MRRLVPALLAVVALASPATAAPRNGITDPKGDWAFAQHDVLSAKLSSALVKKVPVLRGELQLAAPPDGRPATYAIGFVIGCHTYAFDYSWAGAEYHTALSHTAYCDPSADPNPRVAPDEEFPATVTIKGSTVVWEAPYVQHVKKGARVSGMHAWGCARLCTGVSTSGGGGADVTVGDLAYGAVGYVVGSDLPRR